MAVLGTLTRLVHFAGALLRPAGRDESGVVAILAALLGTALIGGAALAIDIGYWRFRAAQLQAAADAVAVSAVHDLLQGVGTLGALTANAAAEAARNGCGGCGITVSWPYKSDSTQIEVLLTDSHAPRFLSVIYATSAKSLSGRAVATSTGQGSSNGGSQYDTGCVLALAPSGANRVYFHNGASQAAPAGSTNPACEAIANSSNISAITLTYYAEIAGRATTPGYIVQRFLWSYVGTYNSGVQAVPDPYASQTAITRAKAGPCADPVSNGAMQTLSINGSNGPGSNGTSQGTVPVANSNGSTWSITGGGHWCNGWQLGNAVLNLGPGTYIIDGTFATNGVVINATDPAGTTLLWGDAGNGMAVSFGGPTTINIVAPPATSAGLPGVAIANYLDDPGGTTYTFNANVSLSFQGAIHTPGNSIVVANGATVMASQGVSGCSQIVAYALEAASPLVMGNNCSLAMGVQPFGTATSSTGWGSGGTTTGTTGTAGTAGAGVALHHAIIE